MGENDDGGVMAINGGFYLMESVFQCVYFSLEYLHLLNDLINSRDRILYDWWRRHVAEKEENEENEGARGRGNIFFVIIVILRTYVIRVDA